MKRISDFPYYYTMVSINYPLCSSSSNVFSWKILLEEWTQAAEGDCVPLPFGIVAPTDGMITQLKLEVYPNAFTFKETGVDIDRQL